MPEDSRGGGWALWARLLSSEQRPWVGWGGSQALAGPGRANPHLAPRGPSRLCIRQVPGPLARSRLLSSAKEQLWARGHSWDLAAS